MFDAKQYRLFDRFHSGSRFEPRGGILASHCLRLPVVRTLITRCPPPLHPENMATYSDAMYIDESGNGSPTNDILRCWVSVAVSLAFDQARELDEGGQLISSGSFSPYLNLRDSPNCTILDMTWGFLRRWSSRLFTRQGDPPGSGLVSTFASPPMHVYTGVSPFDRCDLVRPSPATISDNAQIRWQNSDVGTDTALPSLLQAHLREFRVLGEIP